jgi:hypothetical protein
MPLPPSIIGTFSHSRMDVNILFSNRYLEHFLVVINWDYMLAYIKFSLTYMQRVGGEYKL